MRNGTEAVDTLGMVDAAAAGRWFTEALTEGLARATARRDRTAADHSPAGRTAPGHRPVVGPPSEGTAIDTPPTGRQGSGAEPAAPFATAVLTAFEASLARALTAAEHRDSTLRSALSHEARRVLLDALDTGRGAAGRPAVRSDRTKLSARHRALVSPLVLECLVLVLAEGPHAADAPERLHSLARELGRSTRAALASTSPS
ncbi:MULTISPECIES: hypothetical protein [Streptomyces]|uniref:TetR family transcriptional regulator n=1 Tax=Streptomyces caniscabiei TaxID=2746961 RepID=A0ABU4N1G7_9ACTN|nr:MULTISPECIES: hypothetical protein [Streptomyces]MBE4734242.1 hypothetical protein [Streptomyces caniscabiei]MBE4755113.1 hypothetical protein [Streptomyces caniscabiei]MBE4771092.1 hypothetical protein [Streptomyces caniscabiei]MBE4783602.1 hypothetical protein [Streptomyces caniscabiei]MBE4792906.1 hypothetical protein [Streptomyces caniscabiei]